MDECVNLSMSITSYSKLLFKARSHLESGGNVIVISLIFIITKLWNFFFNTCFKIKIISGKPVIFIINACQGSKYDHGIYFTETKSNSTDSNFNESEIDTKPLSKEDMSHMEIPDQNDLLLIYSTAPGMWKPMINYYTYLQSAELELFTSVKILHYQIIDYLIFRILFMAFSRHWFLVYSNILRDFGRT